MRSHKYLSAVGSVRVLETRLLREADIETLLSAKSFEEAIKLLYETGVVKYVQESKSPEDIQKVLILSLYETKIELMRLVLGSKELDVLWLQYDLWNAKAILKGKILRDNPMAFVSMALPFGKYSIEKLVQILENSSQEDSEKWISDAFLEALKRYKETKDPLEVEYILDTFFFAKILEIAKKKGGKDVLNFLQNIIDATNISASVRFLLRNQENTPFISGGILPQEIFQGNTLETLGERVPKKWRHAVKMGIEGYKKSGNLSLLEQNLAGVVASAFESAKRIIDGPEPLMAYFWRRQHTFGIVRAILLGKKSKISEQEIRAHLPLLF